MHKLVFLATATVALAACGSKEEAPPAPAETTVATTDTASAGQMAGTYEVKQSDGTVVRQQVNADGTYVDTDLQGSELVRGTWRQQGAQLCFDPAGDAPEACYTGGTPGADGSFEVRDSSGAVTSTVKRIENVSGVEVAPAE